MKNKPVVINRLAALFTVVVWGTTYIFTKYLLARFWPGQLLLVRLTLAWFVLLLFNLRDYKRPKLKYEIVCFFLALTGVFGYFMFESFALTKTYSANVGLLMSTTPLFTAIISHVALRSERFTFDTGLGFVSAISGISIVLLNGAILKLNPAGDIFALLAAVSFAFYSVIMRSYPVAKEIGQHVVVRKTFGYAALLLVPVVIINGGYGSLKDSFLWMITDFKALGSMIFLVLIASSLCFFLWNVVVDRIGPVQAAGFIYLVPLVSTLAAGLVLMEKITAMMIAGGFLIVLGVYISESKPLKRFNKVDSISPR
ncbi:MAG: EamA family transporter [Spirochaetes bacterium]|nr:EamA family transporter [Spirochaetota bacterium]MBN2770115.1 EamA family transporter [Spirochaetota bacterium]